MLAAEVGHESRSHSSRCSTGSWRPADSVDRSTEQCAITDSGSSSSRQALKDQLQQQHRLQTGQMNQQQQKLGIQRQQAAMWQLSCGLLPRQLLQRLVHPRLNA